MTNIKPCDTYKDDMLIWS